MKELLLKIAGVKTEEAFYKKFPDQKSFFKAHPEAKEIIAQYQQQEMMDNAPENSQEQMMGTEEEMVEQMAMGGMIKRKDGSYSKRGLWDNIRANKGSGKKPTKQMLEQAKKIQAEEMMYGGMINDYSNGGGINNPGFKALPKSVQNNIIANMAMGGMVDSYYNGGGINNEGFKALPKAVQENIISNMSMGGEVEEYKNGGYTVRKSNDRKGKTHVVTGPDGTKKYFGDPKLGERSKSKYGKEAFYARHKTNLKNNPFFRAYARSTWADGGILPEVEQLMLAGQNPYNMGGYVEYPTYYPGGGMVGSDMMDYQADYNYPTMYPGGGMIAGPMMGYEEDDFLYAMGGGININPANEGKFTEWAAKRGMTVQEAANKVMANRSKYTADVVKMANFAKNAAGWKKAMGGRIYEEGGMLNSMTEGIPVQTETFEGQAEQVALPDGTIKSVEATTSHENMSDGEVTDLLPGGSHIQSARNKLTPDQYVQLMQMFKPESAEQDIKKLSQVYQSKYGKKNGKKLSPADISEYAKNKYQNKSTPNAFDTDKLKEGNKKAYLDLSIQMNDLIKSGKELAEGAVMEEQMMAYGGMVNKYQGGTRGNMGVTYNRPELDEFGNPIDYNVGMLSNLGISNEGAPTAVNSAADYFSRNRNFTSVPPEEGYISGATPATGYLDAQGNFVALDTYQPWYTPKGIKDYNPNQIRTEKERENANSDNRFNNYRNPSWKGSTWDPGSPEAYRWFRDNFETLKNVLSEKEFKDLESAYAKIVGDPKNPGYLKESILKNSKGYQEALKKAQEIRQIAVDKLNPDFNKNITAKSVAPTWKTIQDLQGNKAFVDKLKQYGINSTNKGTYGQVANLSPEALKDIYSVVTDPKELEILNTGNNLDAQWDRRTQRFIPQTFSSNAEKDAWMKSQGLNEAYNWGYDPANPNNIVVPNVVRTKLEPNQTPAEKAAAQQLAANTPIAPAARVPMQNRFNFGLLEGQLGRGLGANQAVLEAGLAQNPLYIMETPDTYIRSRKNEVPVGNILYNIERAQRNTANALANQTGDWSTLAGNIANAGAQAYNQLGDTLSKLNQTNVALYNETQGLQQDLLGSNMGVRNQNLTNMQNMLNFKRNLFGQKAVKDSEIYSEYSKSMGENAQKEQNQKMEMLNIMASKPDMFKGEQGQMFVNQILGNTGSYNNPIAGTLLDNILSANRYKR